MSPARWACSATRRRDTGPRLSTLTGWPFWAPSDLEAVEHALDLAGVTAADHVVDLGCGDGQVLVAAAQRGCTVAGVECDADLVDRARRALAENDLRGDVVLGDVFDYPLDGATVVFTYLAPATLQRLEPRLQAAEGARLVAVDFGVPGLEPDLVDERNHLYYLPATRLPLAAPGWASAGVLVAVTPGRHSLTCLEVTSAGGPVDLTATPELAAAVTIATGCDDAEEGAPVAVDLRWNELDEHAFVTGRFTLDGAGALDVFAFVTDDVDDPVWEVSDEGVERLTAKVAAGWRPDTFADLVAACDAD